MGWLQSILQNTGRASSEINDARVANRDEQQKMAQWKLQNQELQQRLGQQAAPQVVGSYKGSGGRYVSVLRDPNTGKVSYQESTGVKESSPEEEKVQALRDILKREPTEDEKKIVLGVEPKPSAAQDLTSKWAEAQKIGQQQFPTDPQKAMEFARSLMPGGTGVNQLVFPQLKKTTGLDPVIVAQIGKPPDASVYPKGEDDPVYKAKAKQWGVEAETIKNRMAQQRGVGYNASRPGAYVNNDGDLVTATAGQAMSQGWTPAAPTFQLMSKQAQFQEMENASGKLRGAIEALQPGDAFSPDQVAKLNLASRSPDEGTFHSIVSNLASSTTNERQQDYLIWLQQMGERILSLRNVAGMGQGAQDLRAAIQATLPSITSGSKEFAIKRLDAVDNQIALLHKGIGKLKNQGPGTDTPPPGATIIKWEDVK